MTETELLKKRVALLEAAQKIQQTVLARCSRWFERKVQHVADPATELQMLNMCENALMPAPPKGEGDGQQDRGASSA